MKFHGLLERGLAAQPDVEVTVLVAPPLSPTLHRRGWWPGAVEEAGPSLSVRTISSLNAPIVKQVWAAATVAAQTGRWVRRHPDGAVLVDAAYVSVLPGLLRALRGSRAVVVPIVADIYDYMAPGVGGANRAGAPVRALRRLATAAYRHADGFVFLTSAMDEVLNSRGVPTVVIEGVADPESLEADAQPSIPATIVYAGALRPEYGVVDLVAAFRRLEDPELRLSIYGGGPLSDWLREQSAVDPRVVFHGHCGVAEVVEAERTATLLINPRPTDAMFTRFSFPSKVIEYLSSGTPTLCTRLPGIPSQYFDYLLPIESATADGIEAALRASLSLSPVERLDRGKAGQAFVREGRCAFAQGERLAAFLSALPRRVRG